MSKIRLYGDTSGYVDISAPAVADNRNIDLPTVLDSKLDLAGGKILQIVRATDATTRTTTSTSYVDSNLSVTITPQKNDSAVVLIAVVWAESNGGAFCQLQITDNSNNPISGAEDIEYGQFANTTTRVLQTLFAYATPATTSATTYKLRFSTTNALQNARLINAAVTAQMYAIEVSA